MDTVLRIVSDRPQAPAIITNTGLHVLSAASWLRKHTLHREPLLRSTFPQTGAPPLECQHDYPVYLYHDELHLGPNHRMKLLIQTEQNQLKLIMWKRAVEAVQLALNIWGKQHDRVELIDPIKAIIQDEPIKMRHLAKIYNIDVSSLHSIWILHAFHPSGFTQRVDEI